MSRPPDGGLSTSPPAVAALTPSGEPCPAGPDVPREGSREIKKGKIISVPHDWCKSTEACIPYKNWCTQADAGNLANSVRQTDCRSHVQGSYVRQCYGDEPGHGGGIKSGTNLAECTPMTWSSTVRAEGRPMVRRFDKWHMNHGNTWGCRENPEDTGNYSTPKAKLIDAKLGIPDSVDSESRTQFAQAGGTPTLGKSGTTTTTPSEIGSGVAPNNLPATTGGGGLPSTGGGGGPPASGGGSPSGGLGGLNQRIDDLQTLHEVGQKGLEAGGQAGQYVYGDQAALSQQINANQISQVYGLGYPANKDTAAAISSVYGPGSLGGGGGVADANALLSLKAGQQVDFTKMSPQELDALLRKRWPTPDQIRKNGEALKQDKSKDKVRFTKRDDKPECECIVDGYKAGESKCSECHGNFHHIVPDMVYRTGERPTLEADKSSTQNRIPNAPTFNNGKAVCIDSQDHSAGPEGLHGKLRGQLAGLPSQEKGTAPLGDIIGKSKQSLDDIPGLSADCKSKAKSAVDQQVKSQGLSPNQPGRTIEKPLPSPDATTKMLQGHY